MENFLSEAGALAVILEEYGAATDRLCEVDFQQEDTMFAIDDVETIIGEREEIRQRAEIARLAMVEAISALSEEESGLVRGVFEGGKSENAAANEIVGKLLHLQKDIVGKDSKVISELKVKCDEVKAALKELQEDKRKLDFLNVNAAGGEAPPPEFNV